MIKKLSLALLSLFGVLAASLVFRAQTMPSLQPQGVAPVSIAVDEAATLQRFAGAIRIPTISHEESEGTDTAQFLALHAYFEETYPLVHEHLARGIGGGLSLLYTWQGSQRDLEPVVLMAHQDVVPVIPGTEEDWRYPPFDGVIADGFVWGRGAMDDKVGVVSILEAIADLLATREVEPYAYVIDEGGLVARGMVPGLDGAVALIGTAEKGYVNLELLVEGDGGHSSTPPESTNIGILTAAISRVEETSFPAHLEDPALESFAYISAGIGFLPRLAFANLWLFRPVVKRLMLMDPSSASSLRTTTAVTIVEGGVKANVLPIRARAVVNHRIRPGKTILSVLERVREVVDDDRVQVRVFGDWGADPSPVSDASGAPFQMLARTIMQIVPDDDVIVAPYVVPGGTDAKYYSGRSRHVFRFLPTPMEADALQRIHGTNERMSKEGFVTSIKFFQQLIRNSDGL